MQYSTNSIQNQSIDKYIEANMGLCVYCRQERNLTKEHILPSFIYKYQESMLKGKPSGWCEKAKKIVGGEAVVKDVCAECNNIVLSKLDEYAKKVLYKAGVFTPNFTKLNVTFEYQYDLLAKWLLKLAYNSSRASGIQEYVFEKFKDLILSLNTDFSKFVISAGLLKPLKLTHSERIEHGKVLDVNKSGYVNPFYPRISWSPQNNSRFHVKQVVIGALVFHIVSFEEEITRKDRKFLTKQYLRSCTGMKILRKNDSKAKLVQIPLTFIDSMQYQMLRADVEPHLHKLISVQPTNL